MRRTYDDERDALAHPLEHDFAVAYANSRWCAIYECDGDADADAIGATDANDDAWSTLLHYFDCRWGRQRRCS